MTRGSVDHDLGNWKWKVIFGVVTHFWVPTKQNEKIQKISKTIFRRNPKNNRSEKMMLECRKNAKIG
jgi:hypothetical protein